MSAACCVGAAIADAPRVLRAGGVAISCCCRRCCCCCCCWPLGCCHVYKHLHTYIHALLSFSHCPSGAQGGGPLALCYGSLHYYRCLLTAARMARGLAGTILISMLQQLPHHRRIIRTRKYARTCTHTTANLSSLCPSAASRTTMTTRRSPAAATLGQGA